MLLNEFAAERRRAAIAKLKAIDAAQAAVERHCIAHHAGRFTEALQARYARMKRQFDETQAGMNRAPIAVPRMRRLTVDAHKPGAKR